MEKDVQKGGKGGVYASPEMFYIVKKVIVIETVYCIAGVRSRKIDQ